MDRPEYATKPRPLTATPETTVAKAVSGMSELNYGSVMVVDEADKVIGVVTERDIMNKLVARGLDANATPLSAIMTENPRLARETDDMLNWLRIMSNERFRRLPVVDADGRIKAVFTQGDFVSYTWPDLMYQMKSIASATFSRNPSTFLVIGSIAVYTIVLIVVLARVLGS
jgi:CBS domain-containing protein